MQMSGDESPGGEGALADNPVPAPESTNRKRRRRETTPAQRALGLLVRREHSRPELARKLVARGIPADEAAAAVERMTAEGWQDDRRFAISLARTRVANGYGPLRIRAELATHRLDPDTIAAAFAALAEAGEDDWHALARDLVRRRIGSAMAGNLALQRRAADLLIRRGFDGDSMRIALRAHTDD